MRADHSTILALSMTGGLLSVCSLPVTSFETALLASTIAPVSSIFHPEFPDIEDNTLPEEAQMQAETDRMEGIEQQAGGLTSASSVNVEPTVDEHQHNLEDTVIDPGEQHDGRRSQRRQRRSKEKNGRLDIQPNDRA
jgi:hypothetical protein